MTPPSSPGPLGPDAYDALLALHGRQFVRAAYDHLLGRPADEVGEAFYLGRLLAGAPKLQLLKELRESEEARAHGLAWPALDRWISRWNATRGAWGWYFRQRYRLEGLQPEHARLRALEQGLYMLHQDQQLLHQGQQLLAQELTQLRTQTASFDAEMVEALSRSADSAGLDQLLAESVAVLQLAPPAALPPVEAPAAVARPASASAEQPTPASLKDQPIALSNGSVAEVMAQLQAGIAGSREAAVLGARKVSRVA